MKTFILTAFALTLSFQSFAQEFSIFDLYEVAEGTEVEVIDPRMSDLNKTLREVHKMTPRNNDYECSYTFHGTRLSFPDVLKLLPKEFSQKVVRTRTGDRLLKSLKGSSFTVASAGCGTHNYTSNSLIIVENNLKFGLDKTRITD